MSAFEHVMLDIETLGTRAGCVMFQVGVVAFNLANDSEQGRVFDISIQSSLDHGFKIEESTLKWWATDQKDLFAKLINRESMDVTAFINRFNAWYMTYANEETYFWANGTHFDVAILEAYLRVHGASTPWRYNRVRDYRTILHPWFDGYTFAPLPREYTGHDALDDAERQKYKLKEALICLSKHNKAWLTPTM